MIHVIDPNFRPTFAHQLLGLDIETTGLNPFASNATPRLVGLTDLAGNDYVFDVWKTGYGFWHDMKDKFRFVCHNVQFEHRHFYAIGGEFSNFDCTYYMAKHIYNGQRHSFSLKECVQRDLGYTREDKGLQRSDWTAEVLSQEQLEYNLQDAKDTAYLYYLYYSKFAENTELVPAYLLDLKVVPILTRMEHTGIYMDVEVTRKLKAEYELRLQEQMNEIQSMLPTIELKKPKPGSGNKYYTANGNPTKLTKEKYPHGVKHPETRDEFKEAYRKLGVSIPVVYDKGKQRESISKSTYGLLEHPTGVLLEEYYSDHKILTSYINPVLPEYEGGGWISHKTGRIHSTMDGFGTGTSRLAISDPATNTLPKNRQEIRKGVKPSQPGYSILKLDYAQIEPRIMAKVTDDPELNRIYTENKDLYKQTIGGIKGINPENASKDDRHLGKQVYLALQYDQTVSGTQKQLWRGMRQQFSYEECQHFSNQFRKTFVGIDNLHKMIHQACNNVFIAVTSGQLSDPYVRIKSMLGLVKAFDVTRMPSKHGQRGLWIHCSDAINFKIQSTAGAIMKTAMVMIAEDQRLAPYLWHNGLYMILQVHDELVFELRDDLIEYCMPVITECMINAAKCFLPDILIGVEASYGPSWGETVGDYNELR